MTDKASEGKSARVLIVSSSPLASGDSTSIWLRRYFDRYDRGKLFWTDLDRLRIEAWHFEDITATKGGLRSHAFRLTRRFIQSVFTGAYFALIRRIVMRHGITNILFVLELATWPRRVQIARIARECGAKLHILILDDPIAMGRLLGSCDAPSEESLRELLGGADSVLVVSDEMRVQYASWGLETVNVFPPLAPYERVLGGTRNPDQTLRVGVIGTLYPDPGLKAFFSCASNVLVRLGWQMELHVTRRLHEAFDHHIFSASFSNISVLVHSYTNESEIVFFASGMDCFMQNALFLPQLQDLTSSQFPSKLPFYLGFNKPILSVGPPYYPGCRYLAEKSFAIQVPNQEDEEQVFHAISRLVAIVDGKVRLNHDSYETAYRDFDPRVLQPKLYELFVG